MRTISSQLKQEFIEGYRATLVKFTTKTGAVHGYTDFDAPIAMDGVTYTPAPGLSRTRLTATSNDTVSNQELSSGWVDAPEDQLLAGAFDNALVEISFCSWRKPEYGAYIINRGNIGVIQWSSDGFRADIQSHMRQLQRNIVFNSTASCRHQLFSAYATGLIGACTLNKSSYTFNGSVAAIIEEKLKFSVSGLSQVAQYFQNGILTWTTGSNAGLKHEVKGHTTAGTTDIELFLPTFTKVNPGDQFSVTAGCDKTFATCKSKFNNAINFGGFPHIQSEAQYR